MIKTIWMCWFQGEANLEGLNKKCVSRWKELNPDWQVNVLSNKTIADYIPEYFDIVNQFHHPRRRTYTNKSELLRALLLDKYGGVWVDASVYPMKPLDDFYGDIVNETEFFTYRFNPRLLNNKDGNRETVSWFVCVKKPKHYLVSKLKKEVIKRYLACKYYKYYTFHDVLTELYDSDNQIKQTIDNMVQISQKIPMSKRSFGWKHRKPSYVYKRPPIKAVIDWERNA